MPPTDDGFSARAQEIQGVLDQCVDRLAEGESITKEQVIAAHRDLMPELADELRKLSLIERAQRRARNAGSSSGIGATVEAKGAAWIKDGDTIPGYKIIRELHRGGQGIVYEAFQESTRRKVAVKVMKEGPFAGPADEARFSREVQVLGQLRHPNIVAIHDSGSSAGHHYFAMDYVPGQPLDAYMASARPSLDDTLRLFAKICEAVNAAHLRGVIHRDLKPGNIRIDTDGEPRILDFGLAKVAVPDAWHSGPPLSAQPEAAGPQPMTMTGQFLGSLPWASPEQAEAMPSKIDVRTDVYSLGVILYHMLTGKFPYDVLGNMRDVIDNILTAEPVRPSTIRGNGDRLTRRINDEVETIVLKCLQKQRDRRYQTAGELARDVNHYLNGEPIEAKRDSLAYVLRKQLKRYRIPTAIAASFVVLITAGLIVSLTLWQRSERALTAEQEQREVAEKVVEFLNEDLLSQADPYQEPDRDIRLRDVVDRAAERIEGSFEEQPLVEAMVRYSLGRVYRNLGEYASAQPHLERSLELRKLVLGSGHPDTLLSIGELAWLYAQQGSYDEAEGLLVGALEASQRALGDDDSLTLNLMSRLGLVYTNQGRYDEAEQVLLGALDTSRRVLGDEDPFTQGLRSNLADVYRAQGRYGEAESLAAEALEIQSAVLGDEHPQTLQFMNTLASVYCSQGRYADAAVMLERILGIQKRVLGPEHPETLTCRNNLAVMLNQLGRYAEAEPLLVEALAANRHILGDDHPNTLLCIHTLAMLYAEQGRYDEAEPLTVEVFEACRCVLGEGHPHTLMTMSNLAMLRRDQGRHSEAALLFEQLLEIEERVQGPEHPDTLTAMNNLALLYSDQGRYDEAEPLFIKTLAICRRVLETDHPMIYTTMHNLGRMHNMQGRFDAAEPLLKQAYDHANRSLPDGHWRRGAILTEYGRCLSGLKRCEEAETLLLKGHEILASAVGPSDHRTIGNVEYIIQLYEAWDKPGQAAEWRAKLPPADSDAPGNDAAPEPDSP